MPVSACAAENRLKELAEEISAKKDNVLECEKQLAELEIKGGKVSSELARVISAISEGEQNARNAQDAILKSVESAVFCTAKSATTPGSGRAARPASVFRCRRLFKILRCSGSVKEREHPLDAPALLFPVRAGGENTQGFSPATHLPYFSIFAAASAESVPFVRI